LRRQAQDPAGLAKFINDEENVLLETDSGNSTVARYTLAPEVFGSLVAMRRSNASSFYHYDALGSADCLTDSSQSILVSYLYRAFGEQTVVSGSSANRFGWVGQLGYYCQPDTSDYWVRANILMPRPGRWQKREVFVEEVVNLYAYAGNQPLALIDPSGLLVRCVRLGCIPGLWHYHVSTKKTHGDWVLIAADSTELELYQWLFGCGWDRKWTSITQGYRERTWYCMEFCIDTCTGDGWSRNSRHVEVQDVYKTKTWHEGAQTEFTITNPAGAHIDPWKECRKHPPR